jgi:hypothetical protein
MQSKQTEKRKNVTPIIIVVVVIATLLASVAGFAVFVNQTLPKPTPTPTATPTIYPISTPSPSSTPTEEPETTATPSPTVSVPTPSPPQFTIQFVNRSYDVPPTTEYDTYTNTTHVIPGYHVENDTIDIIIVNQPFTPVKTNGNITGLYYTIRYKGVYGDWVDNDHGDKTFLIQASSGQNTVVTYILSPGGWGLTNNSRVDIQVRAEAGFYFQVWTNAFYPFNQYMAAAKSGWSDTQTITYLR